MESSSIAGPGQGVLIVGGYGVVGAEIAKGLRGRHQQLPLLLGGRSPDKGAELADQLGDTQLVTVDTEAENPLAGLSERPALVVTAANDPHDRVLLAATHQGIPVVDITRWTARVQRALLRLSAEALQAPVILASSWMGGMASLAAAAASAQVAPVERIEIDICYALGDRAGSDSIEYVDRLTVPFETTQKGKQQVAYPLSDGKKLRFPGGRKVRTYRLDTPEQITLPSFLGASTVATRIGYDSRVAGWFLVLLKRLGILRLLQRDRFTSVRRAILHSSGEGDRAMFVVAAHGAQGQVTAEVVDEQGQAHLTAVGAVLAAERALGLDGQTALSNRIWFPEQFASPADHLEAARSMGVEVVLR